jgi:bacillithiol biosynthesis deacetylase BshB1
MKIAVVGPHPDDQELAMGGTIALLVKQGHDVAVIDMTNGEPTPFGSPEVRAREAAAAAKVLGVKRLQLGLVNREVQHTLDARHRLAAVYRSVRPEIIFIPYPFDAHPDHMGVTRIAEDARFDAKLTKSKIPGEPWYAPRVLYYFCTHLRINFPATFCIDTTAVHERKLQAVKCYKSQFIKGRTGPQRGAVIRYVNTINQYFGGTINVPYAEPFWSREMLGLRSLGDLLPK